MARSRAKNDWAGFQPALEGVVALVREEAAMRAEVLGLDPYDALMEQYDPGNRAADITPVFAELKTFLRDFVPKRLRCRSAGGGSAAKPLAGPYPIEKQRELGLAMMGAVGFDFTHGSLSVSHHPFCGGVPTDVRITTRYKTADFLSALMGVLHETGHALYEQNLPKAWAHWPLGKARGMAVHESQSLFVEKQVGRNPAFWRWALPVVEQHLGETLVDRRHPAACAQGRARPDPRRCRRGDLSAARHPALRAGAGAGLRPAGSRRHARGMGRQDARLSRPVDDRQSGRRTDAGRALAGRRLRLFPVLYAGRDDGGAAMGGDRSATMPFGRRGPRKGKFDAINDWRREHIW